MSDPEVTAERSNKKYIIEQFPDAESSQTDCGRLRWSGTCGRASVGR